MLNLFSVGGGAHRGVWVLVSGRLPATRRAVGRLLLEGAIELVRLHGQRGVNAATGAKEPLPPTERVRRSCRAPPRAGGRGGVGLPRSRRWSKSSIASSCWRRTRRFCHGNGLPYCAVVPSIALRAITSVCTCRTYISSFAWFPFIQPTHCPRFKACFMGSRMSSYKPS